MKCITFKFDVSTHARHVRVNGAEYIQKGIVLGKNFLLFSNKTLGADIRLMTRTLYLGLKHNSPFELLTGSLIGTIVTQKIPYGSFINPKPY